VKAKLLCDAGEIAKGEDVEVITKAKSRQPRKPRTATGLEYNVRDDAGHEESVATSDLQVVR
jgi:hypothetical protein